MEKEIVTVLSDAVIELKLDPEMLLDGVQTFLMVLVEAGKANPADIGLQLDHMSRYWLQPKIH